jgi:Asp-tRNA(Asn)/Glu-tRNA(Gln) amidotransferase C subunit
MSACVLKFAKLIKISVNDTDVSSLDQAIQNVIEMANSLSKIDTSGIPPLFCSLEDEYSSSFLCRSADSAFGNCDVACDKEPVCVDDLFVNCVSSVGNLFNAPLIINKGK